MLNLNLNGLLNAKQIILDICKYTTQYPQHNHTH